jgi:hypothetical protein
MYTRDRNDVNQHPCAFVADGVMTGAIAVNSGATLSGVGSVGAITLNSGAIFLPGSTATNTAATNRTTTLTSGGLTVNSATMTINLYGPTNYTQLVANGPVNLNNATLQVNLDYAPSASDSFQIISGTGAITGTFNGLPNNSLIHLANNYVGRITYTGNVVTITSITKGLNGSVLLVE